MFGDLNPVRNEGPDLALLQMGGIAHLVYLCARVQYCLLCYLGLHSISKNENLFKEFNKLICIINFFSYMFFCSVFF